MNITNSPDISQLLIRFVVDLSGAKPRLVAENLSVGANLAQVLMAFEAYSPNGVAIHKKSLSDPDTVGNFVELELDSNFPTYKQVIEWSGNPYTFKVWARDSLANTYELPLQKAVICPPSGNNTAGKHYGAAKMSIDIDCARGELQLKNITNFSYAGKDPSTKVSDKITVIAPADETGTVPAPAEYPNFTQLIHYLTYSGPGYLAAISSVRRYDLGDNVSVVIRYQKSQKFDVNCHYDLCPLLNQYKTFLEKNEGKCDSKTTTTIGLINAKLLKAVIAKQQPLCGYDLGKIIEEIKELGNFDADCNCACSQSFGFNISGSTQGGQLFTFNTDGDITASAQVIGNNILIDLRDYSYAFKVEPFGSPTNPQAFTIVPTTNGRNKIFSLNVNRDVLAAELLDTIANNETLLNKLRDITASDFSFIVDGKEIIQSNEVCDQELTIGNVPPSVTYVQLNTLTIDGIVYKINQSFNGTDASIAALNVRLAKLNKGDIIATYLGQGEFRIASAQNARKISKGVIYYPSFVGADAYKTMQYRESNCTNSVAYTPSTIVQAIIDYIMKLTADNIKIGEDFTMCQFNADGTMSEVHFYKTDSLTTLINVLRDNSCRAVKTGTSQNGTVNCETIKAVFNETAETIQPVDFVLGTRNQKCGRWTIEDMFKQLSQVVLGTNDTTIKSIWDSMVMMVYSDEQVCNPITYMEAKMDVLGVNDFIIVPGPCNDPSQNNCAAVVFAGAYTNEVLDFPVTVTVRDQIVATGVTGVTNRDVVMTAGSNRVNDFVTLFPGVTLPPERKWIVYGVSLPAMGQTKKYLHIKIKNNGAKNYKVAYRVKGTVADFQYSAVTAQPGAYTMAIFDVPENEYETSVIVVCGPGVQSPAFGGAASSCPSPLVFNVIKGGQNFIVSYKFPAGITRFNLRVKYPNNGSFDQVLDVQDPGVYNMPVPSGVYGTYVFDVRAVCNEASGWFGAFSSQVPVNVEATSNTCPIVQGVVVDQILDTTARATIQVPLETAGITGYTILLTAPGVDPLSFSGAGPVFNLVGLAANKTYHSQVITNCNGGATSNTFDGGAFTTAAPAGEFRVYWGVKDVAGQLTPTQIKASAYNAAFADGSDVVADWRYNTAPKYLWLAIPAGQTPKTVWFGSSYNFGNVGNFPETFRLVGTVTDGNGSFNYYETNFKTQQASTTITFKNNEA